MSERILHIESATTACSVALAESGKLLALAELDGSYTHAENLTVFVEEVFRKAGYSLSSIDAVAVSSGPGSYTGLRIGVSAAKGFCYALDKPLLAIGTLDSMCDGFMDQQKDPGAMYCPMIDARRMEVYTLLASAEGATVLPVHAKVVDEHSFRDLLASQRIHFFGNGAAKCREVLGHPNAVIHEDFAASARYMVDRALRMYREGVFADLAYFEPGYLKEFIPGKGSV